MCLQNESENFATPEFFASYSNQIFTDTIHVGDKKVNIKTRAPTVLEREQVKQLAGKDATKHAVFTIMKCLVEPKVTKQSEIENWNIGLLVAIYDAIMSHTKFALEDNDFLK